MQFVSRRLLIGIIAAALGVSATFAAFAGSELAVIEGATMGTSYRILVDAEGADTAELAESVAARLDQIEQRMSTWQSDSEVSRFNRFAADEWFPVSEDTARVVAESLRIAKASGGQFDVTVAPLIRLWHFDGESGNRTVPTDESIAETRQHVGWQKLQVRIDPPALLKSDPQLEINLSAIAKGYAVDEVAKLMTEAGYSRHLVEIGGEMRASGHKPDGTQWRVGIEAPVAGQRGLYQNQPLPLEDQAIATSGDYRNFFEVDGKRYSHTIDPATGRPVTHSVASVSIIADSCMLADGLATAINVLGIERGLALAEQEGVAVFVIHRDGDRLAEEASTNFPAFGTSDLRPATKDAGDSPIGTYLAAAAVFGLAVTGMAVGVIFSNRRLRGTCGGLNNMPGVEGSPCDLCETPADECRDPLKPFRRKSADSGDVAT